MRQRSRYSLIAVLAVGAGAWGARPALAHGFGVRYDLPIPLGLYLLAAGAAVALSFLAMALLYRGAPGERGYPRLRLLSLPSAAGPCRGAVTAAVRLLAFAMFVLVIVAGLIGDQSPLKNIAPATIWILWWVGLAYATALLGNLWPLINPWASLFRLVERIAGRPVRLATYPRRLGAWPAVALFLGFTWIELVWPGSETPARLAAVILAYSVVTWAGMAVFGARDWLRGGEAFTLAFSLLARFAPIELAGSEGRARAGDFTVNLRPYAVGLLSSPVSTSMTAFVLVMLATVTFDGFLETPLWLAIKSSILSIEPLAPLLFALRDAFGNIHRVIETVGLVTFAALFFGAYLGFCRLIAALDAARPVIAGPPLATGAIARAFVLSLLPIAIAYHLAHYLSYFLIAGQIIVPLISDPFGFGWNLFGTARYSIDIAIVNARTIWYVSVAAIVTGHMIAVYLAHVTAIRLLGDRRRALRSQFPMLALMVGYTMVSLWILAQPIVAG